MQPRVSWLALLTRCQFSERFPRHCGGAVGWIRTIFICRDSFHFVPRFLFVSSAPSSSFYSYFCILSIIFLTRQFSYKRNLNELIIAETALALIIPTPRAGEREVQRRKYLDYIKKSSLRMTSVCLKTLLLVSAKTTPNNNAPGIFVRRSGDFFTYFSFCFCRLHGWGWHASAKMRGVVDFRKKESGPHIAWPPRCRLRGRAIYILFNSF